MLQIDGCASNATGLHLLAGPTYLFATASALEALGAAPDTNRLALSAAAPQEVALRILASLIDRRWLACLCRHLVATTRNKLRFPDPGERFDRPPSEGASGHRFRSLDFVRIR